MRISDWSSDVCSSDLSCSASPCRPAPMRPRCWRSWGPYTIRRVASDRSSETHERHWPGPTGGVESKSTHGIAPCAGNQENRHESHSRYCCRVAAVGRLRSEEHTSELQSLMRISYAVLCLKKHKR